MLVTPRLSRAGRAGACMLLLALSLQCSGMQGEGSGEPDRLPRAANRCILKRTISSWKALDARRFKVFADREYVVELLQRCGSLTLTEEIGFISRDSQVCDYRADDIQTDRERCTIGSIRTVEELEQGSVSTPPSPAP